MASKLWLCQTLECLFPDPKRFAHVHIYGAWYGLLHFLFLTRERFQFESISLLDIDAEALQISRRVLDHWKFEDRTELHFRQHDCSYPCTDVPPADLVINTSSEHFQNTHWWSTIPSQAIYVVQSTNMEHVEHVSRVENVLALQAKLLPDEEPLFKGDRHFSYPGFQFQRCMIIGQK